MVGFNIHISQALSSLTFKYLIQMKNGICLDSNFNKSIISQINWAKPIKLWIRFELNLVEILLWVVSKLSTISSLTWKITETNWKVSLIIRVWDTSCITCKGWVQICPTQRESLQALTTPQRKKSAGRSVDAMFYIVVTLITPQSFKIRPLEAFEKIAFFHFFTYDG